MVWPQRWVTLLVCVCFHFVCWSFLVRTTEIDLLLFGRLVSFRGGCSLMFFFWRATIRIIAVHRKTGEPVRCFDVKIYRLFCRFWQIISNCKITTLVREIIIWPSVTVVWFGTPSFGTITVVTGILDVLVYCLFCDSFCLWYVLCLFLFGIIVAFWGTGSCWGTWWTLFMYSLSLTSRTLRV